MWVCSIPTQTILPHVVATARRQGYSGLIFVLARTAEASALHNELTNHWTSIHDVTGQGVAVVCPNPVDLLGLRNITNELIGDGRVGRRTLGFSDSHAIHNLQIVSPRGTPVSQFNDRLLDSAGQAGVMNSFTAATRPDALDLHHAAWTEAVSRCATYFGIGEHEIPAILALGLDDSQAMLLRVDPQFSIYSFCKAIAVEMRCGEQPSALFAKIDKLRSSISQTERSIKKRLRDIDEFEEIRRRLVVAAHTPLAEAMKEASAHRQVQQLRVRLQAVAHVEPALVRSWQGAVDALEYSGTRKDAQELLYGIRDYVRCSSDPHVWLGLDVRVERTLRSISPLNAIKDDFHRLRVSEYFRERAQSESLITELQREFHAEVERLQAENEEARRQLRAVQETIEELKHRERPQIGFAEVCVQAARSLGAKVTVHQRSGHAGLAGYQLHLISQDGSAARGGTVGRRNDFQGEVHGSVVQAYVIEGGVHIYPKHRQSKRARFRWTFKFGRR